MFRSIRAENGVVYYASDKLSGVKHGFSTRVGGVSRPAHTSSLNLAFGRGDGDETVIRNVKLFAEAVGFDGEELISVPQIHSDRILTVTEDMRGEGVTRPAVHEGDGYVIKENGLFAAVKTADCVPVLLFDSRSKVCAAVHAGWRGTFARIAEKAVLRMTELGCDPSRICAAVGPAINGECYEVGEDVYLAARDALGARVSEICVAAPVEGKYFCDLKAANRMILLQAGLDAFNVDVCPHCTHCEEELFYSHRASGGKRGTMMSVIGM